MNNRHHLALLVLVLTVAILGCNSSQGSTLEKAPDFDIDPYGGFESSNETSPTFYEILDDGKPVVLNMWAGLCPPCRAEMPDLQYVYDDYEDRIVLIGLDVGPFTGLGTEQDGRELIEELDVTYPTGATSNELVVREYGVLGMPSTYFIKPNGDIYLKWTGLLTRKKLAELTEELIDNS